MSARKPMTLEQMRKVLDERAWETVPSRDCQEYVGIFCKRASECEKAGYNAHHVIYAFLARICTLRLDPASDDVPLAPGVKRYFPTIDDITEEELCILGKALQYIDDQELKGRVADILWLTRATSHATHEIAMFAVQSYLGSAKAHWTSGNEFGDLRAVDRMVRAIRIARRLGHAHPAVKEAKLAIDDFLNERKKQPSFPLAGLIEALYHSGLGDARLSANYSVEMAEAAEGLRNWRLAREYWQLAAGWLRRCDDDAGAQEAMRRGAETYVGDADAVLKRPTPSNLAACHFLGQAIHALRGVAGQDRRGDEIHRRLLECQKAGMHELTEFQSDPIDLKDSIEGAESHVRGKEFQEAVRALAFRAGGAPDVAKLRVRIQERARTFLGMQLLGKSYQNH